MDVDYMDNLVGKRLDGRYELQEIIGVGGMAVVYKAYDNIEDRLVSVKILKDEFAQNDDFIRRFKNESKAIAVLSHPNIVKVYDVSFGDIMQYIVMEYIDGITLKEYIEQQGSLSWKDAIHFTIQILKGLQHAHDKGIVHRDVKPQNILLCADGTIKVSDFGIARFARSEHKTMTDKAIGSVHYISPEQARGEPTDEKADIYSVGVMLYEMLTGKLPFQAESAVSVAIMQLQTEPQLPREINGSIPLGLEQITMHAMQKDPTRRYQMAAEMLHDLEEFKRDPSVTFNYNYFIDDSPTRFVSTSDIRDAIQEDEDDGDYYYDDEEPVKRRSSAVPVLAGVAVAVVLCLAGLAIFFIPKLFGSTGTDIKCPNLIGVSYEDLSGDEYADYNIQIVSWEASSDYDYGFVFQQDPVAGKSIKKNKTITVKISTGRKTVKVPDVYTLDANTAITTLKNEGFTVVQAEIQDEDIAKGSVVKTYPVRGDSVPEGSEITIYVSSGAPTVYVDVPNVVGKNKDVARQMILEKGLTMGAVTSVDSSYPEGTVVSQSPDAGKTSQVQKGTSVSIEVSNGKEPVSSSDSKDVALSVSLPADYEKSGDCIVSLWIDGEKISQSNPLDTTVRSEYVFNVSGYKGQVTALVKLNNDNYREYTLDFDKGTYSRKTSYRYPTASNTSSAGSSGTDDDDE